MHTSSFIFLSILLLAVEAVSVHDILHRHRALFARGPTRRAASGKRCPNRKSTPTLLPAGHITSSTYHPTSSPTHVNNTTGLIQVNGNCAPNRATRQVTSVSGPNGHMDWLDCGFEGSGWNPPYVRVKDLITVSLDVALQDKNSPFKACTDYISLFEKHGNVYNIPPIMLASFAMQESSCRPWVVGGAGEQGLMQITKDKCGGAPGGNCQDPDFNIGQGAKYFSQTLSSNGGNVLLAIGSYNGWKRGLTKSAAFAAASSDCCRCQNNGDYLMQFANGWLLNIDPYSRHLGKYFNLDVCPQ